MQRLTGIPMDGTLNEVPSCDAYLAEQCRRYNALPGKLTGFDCPICKNKGVTYLVRDGEQVARECRCMPIRHTMRRMRQSGMAHMIEDYTLERYSTQNPWQGEILKTARRFLEDDSGCWFFIGGQSGAGKTHICTAIATELLARGKQAHFMLWRDDVVRLKANINEEYYFRQMTQLKSAEVLYIDDLFRIDRSQRVPSSAEINIASEIIGRRYNDRRLLTVISSEKTTAELLNIDQGLGSRIYERSKNFHIDIKPDHNKNFRLNI